MRSFLSFFPRLVVAALVAVAFAGCDSSPSTVEDIDIQPILNSPRSFNIVLIGGTNSQDFTVQYQGLDAPPEATGTETLTLEKQSESGDPAETGEQTWRASFNGSADGIVNESIVISSSSQGETVTDTVDVTISPFAVTTDFTADFATVADFEDPQRTVTASGGATVNTVQSVATSSNGLNALQVTGPGGVVFERTANGAASDRLSFLLQPNSDTAFDLTLTLTALVNGSEVDYEYVLPVPAGSNWLEFGIGFAQIGEDFNPVSEAAGGTGPLVRIEFSTSASVTYGLDEVSLATANATQVEINDFEQTSLAYGPPFCPPTFDETDDVASNADGPTARTIQGGGCFGYNYQTGSGGPALFVDADASSVVSFLARGTAGDSVDVFIETADGNAGGFGGSVRVALPIGEWDEVRVPVTDLGSPGALRTSGITNVGFTSAGEEPDFAIDNIRILGGN